MSGGNLEVFYYLSATEIWLDKRGGGGLRGRLLCTTLISQFLLDTFKWNFIYWMFPELSPSSSFIFCWYIYCQKQYKPNSGKAQENGEEQKN